MTRILNIVTSFVLKEISWVHSCQGENKPTKIVVRVKVNSQNRQIAKSENCRKHLAESSEGIEVAQTDIECTIFVGWITKWNTIANGLHRNQMIQRRIRE